MGDWVQNDLPPALSRAKQKIEQWRQRRRPGARIPEQLWREAAELACAHGINRTARALRLDYYSLKRRAVAGARTGEPATEFMEVLPGGMPASRPECTIELEEASGAKMRIHLQGGDWPDVAGLTRVFREGC